MLFLRGDFKILKDTLKKNCGIPTRFLLVHQQNVEVTNAESTKRRKTKRRMGQNVEWKKRRMVQNVEWKKR
jgi:hypothetical protein